MFTEIYYYDWYIERLKQQENQLSDYEKRINPAPIGAIKEVLEHEASRLASSAVSSTGHPNMVQGFVREALAKQEVSGVKHDQEKEPISLLSRVWLLGVARVMAFGAKKYATHNWRGGIERSRLVSAALRHIFAYNEGEDLDPETRLSHLDHASCCLMFARELHDTRPDLDDRWKGTKE